MNDRTPWRLDLVRALEGTPRFYIALFVLLESGLGGLLVAVPTPQVQLIAGVGMVSVAILMVLVAARHYETAPATDVDPDAINPLWGPGSLPLDAGHVSSFVGEWHCEWAARTDDDATVPYVDDTVTVVEVDQPTGEFHALASSTYDGANHYELDGRISKDGVAHLYYQFPAPHDKKVGMAILEVSFVDRRAHGWWLGGGRGETRMIGGVTRWTKAEVDDREWVDRYYDEPVADRDAPA